MTIDFFANETETLTNPSHGANDKRFDDLMAQVEQLGIDAALGKDSLPKLAHAVVRAAADGVIDATEKDAQGNDAAHRLYSKYAASEGTKALHEHSAGSAKAQISKLRQLINMGAMTTIDAVVVMQAAYEVREELRGSDAKLKPAYAFYVDIAREQQKSDTELTREALEELAVKPGAADKTLEGELKRAMKILEGLVTGENNHNLRDDSELTIAAFEAIRERVEGLVKLTAQRKVLAQAAKLGIKI